uniref:Uncharacterized protein n=1 Tax=Anguilla anguilla TaxID=7936 RepID=A0A0E9QW45_ANGAN
MLFFVFRSGKHSFRTFFVPIIFSFYVCGPIGVLQYLRHSTEY